MLIPKIELLAALQQSHDQAVRDGLPLCAHQVQEYIEGINKIPSGYVYCTQAAQ